MKILILSIVLFCFSNKLLAQSNKLQIEYQIQTNQLSTLAFQKLGLRSNLSYDPDFEFKITKSNQAKIKLDLKSNGLYKLLDGFDGHILYFEKGDKVKIKLDTIKNLKTLLLTSYYPSFHTLTANGKFTWHYTYFDELYRRTNKLHRYDIKIHLKQPLLLKKIVTLPTILVKNC